MRKAEIQRDTRETKVFVAVDLDGAGRSTLASGIPFLDHMLDQVARHGAMDLTVRAQGDLEIDAHHTVEDIGITRDMLLREAERFAPPVIAVLHKEGLLERSLRRELEGFYRSGTVEKILGRT